MSNDLSAPAGPAAARLLHEVIAARKEADPLAPVTVVVPSNYAALSLRRRLAAVPPGLVNVGFLVLARLAELLGAAALARAGRRPLSPAVLAHAVRRALAASPGIFKEVAGHPATERALVRAYKDLRALSPPALDAMARHSERTEDVVRLIRAVRNQLAPDWYDDADLLAAAAAAVRSGDTTALGDVGHVVVYAPRRLDAAEQALLDALGDNVTVIDALLDRAAPLPADAMVSAPDPDQEVRAAVRGVMERLSRGAPLHRMAILYPAADPYALLITQHLAAAGIPAAGPGIRRLRESVAGVALLGLLRLPECGWRREDVVAWLSSAPILDGNGKPVKSAAWDRVSRKAGVVEGVEQWQERLAVFAASQAEQLAQVDDDDAHRSRESIERNIEQADELHRFMADLIAAAAPPPSATWAEYSTWAERLLHRAVGGEAAHTRWPEQEQEGWRHVAAVLGRLAALAEIDREPIELSLFTRALEQELEGTAGRLGTFGDGVFVASLNAARATDFETVFVLGLAEGTLPAPDRRTGLLPAEDDRDAVADDHEAVLAALAAANERVLLWPRFDPRRGRERQPSRWLADLDAPTTVVESFDAGVAGALGPPASLTDYDLAELAHWQRAGGAPRDHYLTTVHSRLAIGFEIVEARASARLTRFDGLVGADASAAAGLGAVSSPTSLEVYATCPMRYLLRQVLRVAATDKPEEILRLRPLDKGTLVHTILERYVLTLLDGHPRDLARLLAIAHDAFAEIEARGLTGKPLFWRYERELLLRELRRFHDEDRLTPLAAELVFGMEDQAPVVVALPDGRELRFRGSADRVDVDPDTTDLVVTDYKTGGSREYEELKRNGEQDPVDKGRRLQLPLYALAAADRHPADGPVHARYWFTSERGRFESIGYRVDERVLERLREVLTVIADGISAGVFPARPGEVDRQTYKNCAWCDYDRLCQRDRGRQWERKRTAPALSSYVALAEPGVPQDGSQNEEAGDG